MPRRHRAVSVFFAVEHQANQHNPLPAPAKNRHYAEASRQGRISARRRAPEVPLDAPSDEFLKRAFRTYCRLPIGQGRQVGGSVQHINAAQFNQLCRDVGLMEPAGAWECLGVGWRMTGVAAVRHQKLRGHLTER